MLLLALFFACDRSSPTDTEPVLDLDVEGFSGQCLSLQSDSGWLQATDEGYAWGEEAEAARFRFHPVDLGVYLLYDEDGRYLSAEDGPMTREAALQSDVTRIEDMMLDDTYVSGGEWALEPSHKGGERYQLRNRRNDILLGPVGLADDDLSVPMQLVPAEGCAEHPELSLDAEGAPVRTTFDDGSLYGIADSHSHIFSNYGFGGGNIFHGSAFHRLGVAHALPDCAPFHGEGGRKDFFGFAYDGGNDGSSAIDTLPQLLAGELDEDQHLTAGWPEFPDWPDARRRSTHQTQYYRWLERAWLSGLRLVVQHATSNSVICNLGVGQGLQVSRYDCEDMTAVDRIIDETWALQDYVDARAGGEGLGWFRVVTTPAQAREVIAAGKMAVVLGIEASDLFDCHLTPRPGAPECDEAWVEAQLDLYHERGVRAVFPVHKYDNRFSPGDGQGDFIELGNFFNSGHWTNKTEDCPTDGMPTAFDGGSISFGGLLQPREEYLTDAPNDMSGFAEAPLVTAVPYYSVLTEPGLSGSWCQNGGLTDVGRALIDGLISRGMIIEVDHLPAWTYREVMAILEERDYPAAGTHGRDWDGRLAALGGITSFGLGRCQDPANPGATLGSVAERAELLTQAGSWPGVPFSFDLNGFAGAPGPRFAEGACSTEQENPITYPFESLDGGVSFTQPMVGQRAIDFNQEGMVHIGLLPELLQDARSDAVSDADLDPLFRSAEAWIRMWEKAEARAAGG